MGLCIAIEKPYAKNEKKSIHETPIYAKFSYKSAPKSVGRIDASRFERVKDGWVYFGADTLCLME